MPKGYSNIRHTNPSPTTMCVILLHPKLRKHAETARRRFQEKPWVLDARIDPEDHAVIIITHDDSTVHYLRTASSSRLNMSILASPPDMVEPFNDESFAKTSLGTLGRTAPTKPWYVVKRLVVSVDSQTEHSDTTEIALEVLAADYMFEVRSDDPRVSIHSK